MCKNAKFRTDNEGLGYKYLRIRKFALECLPTSVYMSLRAR